MVKMLSKLFTLYIYLKYPKIPSQQRWFIRFRYLGFMNQAKYFIKDHVIKKPYKIIRFSGEFQQELMHVLPFAYWHYKNGTLVKTISSKHTRPLYFFSPDHFEDENVVRDYRGNEDTEIPNAPHDTKLLGYKWRKVPFKEFYKNNLFSFDKEVLMVANRYNTEWGEPPISYFDLDDLKKIFNQFQDKYQIIYNRPRAQDISEDNSEILELGDVDFIKTYFPKVKMLKDYYGDVPGVTSFNHLQLLIYANCSKFISVHGGTATLCSMFGGVNVIYSKIGHEHALKEFENVFPVLSGCDIKVYRDKTFMISELLSLF